MDTPETPVVNPEEREVNIKYFMYKGMEQLGEKPDEENDLVVVDLRRSKGDVVGRLIKLMKSQRNVSTPRRYYWVMKTITEKRKLKDVPKGYRKGQ